MRIYLASSYRNPYWDGVKAALEDAGVVFFQDELEGLMPHQLVIAPSQDLAQALVYVDDAAMLHHIEQAPAQYRQ